MSRVMSIVSREVASGKIKEFACGCNIFHCFKKQDCQAKHPCSVCRDKKSFHHCGTHSGNPIGRPQIFLV